MLAQRSGYFDAELVAMEVKGKKAPEPFTTDEHPRESTLEMLAQLPLVFKEGRVVTAGNASVRRGCGTSRLPMLVQMCFTASRWHCFAGYQ